MGSKAPLFARAFKAEKPVTSAVLRMTGMGIYEACINGRRVSEDVLAPRLDSLYAPSAGADR